MTLVLSAVLGAADEPRNLLGLTAEDWIAVGTLLLVAVTAAGIWSALTSERRRTQPIVVAHAVGERRFADRGDGQFLDAYLTNEGEGAAFNVHFGVDYRGVRFPWKFSEQDPDTGTRQRVVRAGTRLPEDENALFAIPIPYARAALGGEETDEGRVYWCRYENAFGRMWETRNPWQRFGDMDIKPVHFFRMRDWLERRKRRKVGRRFDEALAADLAAMLGTIEERGEGEQAEGGQGGA
jgi:hypothetical protein